MKFIKKYEVTSLPLEFHGLRIDSPIAGAKPVMALEFDDRILVEFQADMIGGAGEQNISAFDVKGRELWKIARLSQAPPDPMQWEPYLYLGYSVEKGFAYASTSGDSQVRINLEDGTVKVFSGRFFRE